MTTSKLNTVQIASIRSLPYSTECPNVSGVLRQQIDYFQVEEVLGFEPEGDGEHVFIYIEKKALNTQEVAQKLAVFAGLPLRQISYSGMKDRNAITRQWFSVHIPGNKNINFSELNNDNLTVLKQQRHLRKLRRGTHRGNRFSIILTNTGAALDKEIFKEKVQRISIDGFPNYFGEQRFGRGGQNLQKAQAWFNGEFKPKRHLRGIYLSAVRSFLFNQVLASRVIDRTWNTIMPGELVMLNGTNSVFLHKDEELGQRLVAGDIHPTGPMYGKTVKLMPGKIVSELEAKILGQYPNLTAGLEQNGLKSERRSLRVIPQMLESDWKNDQIHLTFTLPSGSFATALVRELVNYTITEQH